MKMRISSYIAVCVLLVGLLTGCTGQQPRSDVKAGSLTDDAGRVIALAGRPEKVVVLSPSALDLWYAVGGTSVGRPSSKAGDIPKAAESVPEVGFTYNINIEKVTALQPDLVIGIQGMHEKLLPALESSKIPVVLTRIKTYDDVKAKIQLFSRIAGHEDKGTELIQTLDSRLQTTLAKVPDQRVKVAILHASAKSITLDLDNSIAGHIAGMLKLTNIAAGSMPLEADPDAAPFSLEKMVAEDPDIIFIVTMGQSADIKNRLKGDVENNPAWPSLSAVKKQQVYYLPQELFLLQPGLKYPEAVQYMAKLAYPEVFCDGQ